MGSGKDKGVWLKSMGSDGVWKSPVEELPSPAPNILMEELLRLQADGERIQAHHLALQPHLHDLMRVQFYGERFPPWFPEILPCHANCIGHSFMDPWGEKKVYTAHIGWENGERNPLHYLLMYDSQAIWFCWLKEHSTLVRARFGKQDGTALVWQLLALILYYVYFGFHII